MSGKFTILLVEDNPCDADLTEKALAAGEILHELYRAASAEDALLFLHHEAPYENAPVPDLILLDINLPGMSGLDLLEIIKQTEILKRVPVIVLTLSESEKDILKTYDLQANGYITKPVDLEEFFTAIQAVKQFWLSVVILPTKNGNSE